MDVYKDWLGIPDGPRPPDHYTLLRLVQFEDDVDKIQKNYKKLNSHVRKYASGQYSTKSQLLLNELAKAMLCLTDRDRKRDYDREQGRVIDDRDELTGRRPLTAYLLDEGKISANQAEEAKAFADQTGISLRDAVVQKKLVDADAAARAYARELGRPFVDLSETVPDDEVLDILPKNVARRHTCLPLFIDDDRVLVACADEPSTELEDEVRLRFSQPIHAVIATPLAINHGLAKYYAAGLRNEAGGVVSKAPTTTKPAKSNAEGKTEEAPAKPKKVVEPSAPLTPEQRSERKNLGYVIACWIVIASTNFDWWVLYPNVSYKFMPGWFPFLTALLIIPPGLWFTYNVYIKD